MPSPFPGMDPYLEHPVVWPGVHNALIAELARRLGPPLRPHYYVRLEERTYLADLEDDLAFVGRPDVAATRSASPTETDTTAPEASPAGSAEAALSVTVPVPDRVRETYLVVRATTTGDVVTVLELLSPTNKGRKGEGRARYEEKRRAVLGSRTHLVEVDLIRAGDPMPVFGAAQEAEYRVLVSRSDRRPRAELRPFTVRQPIPRFALPLRGETEEAEVDVRAALDEVYDTASYDLSTDYRADPVPTLGPEDAAWSDALLRNAGLRAPGQGLSVRLRSSS